MNDLITLKKSLEGISSNLGKIDSLKNFFHANINNYNTELLKIIYNPFIRFGLTLKEYQKQVKAKNLESKYNINEVISLVGGNPEKIVLNTLLYLSNIQPNITKSLIQRITNLEENKYVSELFCCGLARTLTKGINSGLINKAYKSILKELNKPEEDLIPSFSVALAEDATNKKLSDLINKNDKWYWSRKIDGQRTIYGSNSKCFYSRAGNIINSLNSKIKDVPETFRGYILDGEVAYLEEYTNIESFKLTEMLIRRKDYQLPYDLWWSKKGSDSPTLEKTEKNVYKFKLKYFVFDCLSTEEFQNKTSRVSLTDRLKRLGTGNTEFIEVLQQTEVIYDEHLGRFNIEDLELPDGWEGYMLRRDTEYKGKRSNDMLKLKQFYDTELVCYGVEMTTKRMMNSENLFEDRNCIGALLCKYNGTEVKVGSGLSDYDRLKNKTEYINKQIKVKFTQKIKDKNGVEHLRHPVFICVREEL